MEKDEIKCDVPYVEKGDPADTRLRMWAHFYSFPGFRVTSSSNAKMRYRIYSIKRRVTIQLFTRNELDFN